LADACRVRAKAYAADGAIRPEHVDEDGCFRLPIDEDSWHLLSLDENDNVSATLRITPLPLDSAKRRGRLPHVGESLRRANPNLSHRLAAERWLASLGLAFGPDRQNFVVVGGWAVLPGVPVSGAATALGAWALCRLLDSAGALCVASERHDAHGQLVRTGAVPIRNRTGESLYFDSAYGCKVGLLGFWVYRERNALKRKVDRMETQIRSCQVITYT